MKSTEIVVRSTEVDNMKLMLFKIKMVVIYLKHRNQIVTYENYALI